MKIKTLFILLSMFMLGTLELYGSKAAMSWIASPPSDNDKYFYGVGYGDTQKEAKNDALSNISAKISVDVASSFSSSVTASRHSGNEDVLATTKNEIVTNTKNIQYSDVRVQESAKDGNQWVVLVEVDKDILTATYERKLGKVDDKIKTEWEVFEKAGVFEKLKLSVTIDNFLKETDNFFPLLHAINKNYDDSKYTKRYLDYTKAMRKAKDELVFKIVSDKNSESLASLVRSELSAQNATFNNTNYNVLIEITTKAKMKKYPSSNEKFANLTFALRKTLIKATDRAGNVVSNTEYKTKSGSEDGFEDAIARTAKYEKKIQEKGIVAFITGN